MKKILQALDGASSKPVVRSDDMKRFVQIVEGKGPLNRLTTAESMAVQHFQEEKTITTPVLNIEEDAKPSMIGKYFKAIEQELAESEQKFKDQKNERAKKLAERVIERIVPGQDTEPGINRLTGKPIQPTSQSSRSKTPSGYSKEYLQSIVNGTHPRPMISKEKAQELLNQMGESSVNEADAVDTVTLDIPLIIRLFEYAREDAKTDMDLHNVTEKLIALSKETDVLTMDQYDAIVGEQKLLPAVEESNDSLFSIKPTADGKFELFGPSIDPDVPNRMATPVSHGEFDSEEEAKQQLLKLKKYFEMELTSLPSILVKDNKNTP